MRKPDHIALKYYHSYHSGAAKTLKSIQITLVARLEKFNLESLSALTACDELDLGSLGEQKVGLFQLSFQSHDPSQRSNGFLTLAGGIVVTFAKEILDLIIG